MNFFSSALAFPLATAPVAVRSHSTQDEDGAFSGKKVHSRILKATKTQNPTKFPSYFPSLLPSASPSATPSAMPSPTFFSTCADPNRRTLLANANMKILVSSYLNLPAQERSTFEYGSPMGCWKIGAVTNMDRAFESKGSFTGEGEFIEQWNTKSVTSKDSMFGGACTFNQPLDNWDVSSVTRMDAMFDDAHTFNQPLNNWDVSSVTRMDNMFYNANNFNQPLDNWNLSSVTSMYYMFQVAANFNQCLCDWGTRLIININGLVRTNMFKESGCTNTDPLSATKPFWCNFVGLGFRNS